MDEDDVRRLDEWANRLCVDRTTVLRDALMAYISRLAGEHDAAAYQRQPFSEEELAFAGQELCVPTGDSRGVVAGFDERDAKR